MSNRQIAAGLGVSGRTIKADLRESFRQYGVRTRAQLVRAILESRLERQQVG